MSIYIGYGSLHSDHMSDAGAREYRTCGKLAVVWSVSPENLVGGVDVGAVSGGISCNPTCCLSESAMQGGKSDGKDRKETWEAHGCMWIFLWKHCFIDYLGDGSQPRTYRQENLPSTAVPLSRRYAPKHQGRLYNMYF
jgi:hypothetical protein